MIGRAARLGGIVVVFGGVLVPAGAEAHTAWTNDAPVPEWVRNACCGPSDTHHLLPSQVHPTPGGFRVDGVREVVPWSKVLPSADGDYWIFYRDYADGTQYVFCFFAPPEGASRAAPGGEALGLPGSGRRLAPAGRLAG